MPDVTRSGLVATLVAVSLGALALATAPQPGEALTGASRGCDKRCHLRRDFDKLRALTPREPVPGYIVECESHGSYRALNPSSGAGGKYQVLPSTWASEIARLPQRFVRVAESVRSKFRHYARHDHGPRDSSHLLQDRVGAMIWADSGPGAWSCA